MAQLAVPMVSAFDGKARDQSRKSQRSDIVSFMSFYDEEETANKYIAMAEGSDGKLLIAAMSNHVPQGASVLEIGMGPGTDLDLMRGRYQVTGSDNSRFFVDRYRDTHPDADVLILDAVSLNTDRKFDCIYSNKVLHHLNEDDLRLSLERQHALLNEDGHVMHSFWKGDRMEEIHGLKFFYRTEAMLRTSFDALFSIIDLVAYAELEDEDSIYVLARKSRHA